MGTITSANAVVMLGAKSLFPTPQQLQGFAADDVFSTEDIDTAEVVMGVDGKMSAGFVFVPVPQSYSLQADSPSISFFEALYQAQQAAKEVYFLFGVVTLSSISRSYVMNNGVLSRYKPASDAKKVLQPRTFRITWESITPTPI